MIDVYIAETNAYNGYWLYQVFADGEKVDSFVARPRLTQSERYDTVVTYQQSLEYWRG